MQACTHTQHIIILTVTMTNFSMIFTVATSACSDCNSSSIISTVQLLVLLCKIQKHQIVLVIIRTTSALVSFLIHNTCYLSLTKLSPSLMTVRTSHTRLKQTLLQGKLLHKNVTVTSATLTVPHTLSQKVRFRKLTTS